MSRRAARPETHRELPSAAALRPSRVVANFQVTNGRWCSTAKVHTRLSSRASSSSRPDSTSSPWARRWAAPPDATGLASGWAKTTRRTPAATSAAAQGPVRPVWLQGSSVTTAVVPRADSPARARASASAWAVPAPRWCPSATVRPSPSSSTQPTRGLGPSGTPGEAASARARRIAACSAVVVLMARPALSGRGLRGGRRRRRTRGASTSPACASHPDFHRRSRSCTWSTGHWLWPGRGLSPPARNCTDPRARELITRRDKPATAARGARDDVRHAQLSRSTLVAAPGWVPRLAASAPAPSGLPV